MATFDVRSYGAAIDGSTDDTAAVQAAVNAAAADGGGTVYVPGHGYTKCRVTQIGIRSHVRLTGDGPGATNLYGIDRTLHVIVVDESQGSVEQVEIRDLKVESGLDGIHLTHTNNTNQLSFPRGVLTNVITVGCAGTGIYLDNGCVEYRVDNCHAKSCGADGFRVQSTDMFFTNCTAQANGTFGFRLNGANCHFSTCKAFGNWRGFVVTSRHIFVGCDAQENSNDGFQVGGADTILTGCLADCNGGVGFNVVSPDNHTLTGCHSTSASGLRYKHTAGYRIASGGNRHVRVSGCTSRDAVALAADSDVSGCSIDIF